MNQPRAISGAANQTIDIARTRLVLGGALFAIGFAVIAVRLVSVTLLPHPPGHLPIAQSAAQAPSEAVPPARRADIVDRNGALLATNVATTSVYANPRQIVDARAAAAALARALPGTSEAEILTRLSSDKSFIWIKRNLAPRQENEVNRLGVPGVKFHRDERRVYPHGAHAAHVLGFTDIDNQGIAGIEKTFEDRLKGATEPLRLSIDIRLQHILEEEIRAAVGKFRAIGAAGILVDTGNGEVLALASLPDFDPNDPGTASEERRFNRITLGVYEMGSTFKVFTTAMALEAGKVPLEGGYDASHPIKISRFTISDYKPKNRWLSVPEIFQYSSNIGSARMAMHVGTSGQQEFLGALGMLRTPTFELPEVAAPLVPSPWREINTMTIAFGHGLSVSPLQMANGMTAIVNGGFMVPATLLKRPDDLPVAATRVISSATSDKMRRLLRLVVAKGTGTKAVAQGYLIGGKTGTAEKVGGGAYRRKAVLSSFVGAFPIHNPRYAILILIDEPQATKETMGYATGGWTAAPLVGQIVARAAPLLGLEPAEESDPGIQALIALDLPHETNHKARAIMLGAKSPAKAAEPAARATEAKAPRREPAREEPTLAAF
jgi:cell division protein FtsI (penicillin-binding protein 3)